MQLETTKFRGENNLNVTEVRTKDISNARDLETSADSKERMPKI